MCQNILNHLPNILVQGQFREWKSHHRYKLKQKTFFTVLGGFWDRYQIRLFPAMFIPKNATWPWSRNNTPQSIFVGVMIHTIWKCNILHLFLYGRLVWLQLHIKPQVMSTILQCNLLEIVEVSVNDPLLFVHCLTLLLLCPYFQTWLIFV